jgi:hypothetical protein
VAAAIIAAPVSVLRNPLRCLALNLLVRFPRTTLALDICLLPSPPVIGIVTAVALVLHGFPALIALTGRWLLTLIFTLGRLVAGHPLPGRLLFILADTHIDLRTVFLLTGLRLLCGLRPILLFPPLHVPALT